nr:MAG TPA: hypothetical protein [Caudoviricetes sp.]
MLSRAEKKYQHINQEISSTQLELFCLLRLMNLLKKLKFN